jgi:hypothetical protein
MDVYVIPAYLIMRPLGRYDGKTSGTYLEGKLRDEFVDYLFRDDAEVNLSAHRRFVLVDNNFAGRSGHLQVSFWVGTSSPSRILCIPSNSVLEIAREAFGAFSCERERYLGLHFSIVGREAGVFSSSPLGSSRFKAVE